MTKSKPKLVLSNTRLIPFNKLVLSQANVRRVSNGVSIEDLADDIAHRGLLHNLNVRLKTLLRFLAGRGERAAVLEYSNQLMQNLPDMLTFYQEIAAGE